MSRRHHGNRPHRSGGESRSTDPVRSSLDAPVAFEPRLSRATNLTEPPPPPRSEAVVADPAAPESERPEPVARDSHASNGPSMNGTSHGAAANGPPASNGYGSN